MNSREFENYNTRPPGRGNLLSPRLVKIAGSVVLNLDFNWWLSSGYVSDIAGLDHKDVISILRVLKKKGVVEVETRRDLQGYHSPVSKFWRLRKYGRENREN